MPQRRCSGYLSLGLSFVNVVGGEVGCSSNLEEGRGGERLGTGVSAADVVVGAVGAFYAEAAAFVE